MEKVLYIDGKKKRVLETRLYLNYIEILNKLKRSLLKRLFSFNTLNYISVDRKRNTSIIFLNDLQKDYNNGFYFKDCWIQGSAILCKTEKNLNIKEKNQYILYSGIKNDEKIQRILSVFFDIENINPNEETIVNRRIVKFLVDKKIDIFKYFNNYQLKTVCIADILFDLKFEDNALDKYKQIEKNIELLDFKRIENFFFEY